MRSRCVRLPCSSPIATPPVDVVSGGFMDNFAGWLNPPQFFIADKEAQNQTWRLDLFAGLFAKGFESCYHLVKACFICKGALWNIDDQRFGFQFEAAIAFCHAAHF